MSLPTSLLKVESGTTGNYRNEVCADVPFLYNRFSELAGVVAATDPCAVPGNNMAYVNTANLIYNTAGGTVGDLDTAIEKNAIAVVPFNGYVSQGGTPAALATIGTFECLAVPRVVPIAPWVNQSFFMNSTFDAGAGGGRHVKMIYGDAGAGPILRCMYAHTSNADIPRTLIDHAIAMPLNMYTHIALTYELGGAQNGIELFINGVSVATAPMILGTTGFVFGTTQLTYMGAAAFGGVVGGPGLVVDDCAVYSFVLSPARIAVHAGLVKAIVV